MFVTRRFGQISEIVVKADRYRSGVGQLLMKQAHDWLLAQGVSEVQHGSKRCGKPLAC